MYEEGPQDLGLLYLWRGLGAPWGGFWERETANSGSPDYVSVHRLAGKRWNCTAYVPCRRGREPPVRVPHPPPPFCLCPSLATQQGGPSCAQHLPALLLDLG